MGDVIDIAEYKPHLKGLSRCIECGHEWRAVAPLGTVELEYPQCHTFKGAFVSPSRPGDAARCDCGNQLFYVCCDGATCARCGTSFNF